MAVIFEGMREDENSVTILGRDEVTGEIYSQTESHNGSSWDRENAIDKAMEGALNH